jgi:hypothetical protein
MKRIEHNPHILLIHFKFIIKIKKKTSININNSTNILLFYDKKIIN